jgi:hypothetical protein
MRKAMNAKNGWKFLKSLQVEEIQRQDQEPTAPIKYMFTPISGMVSAEFALFLDSELN